MDVTTVVTPSDVEKVMSNHESAGVENNSNEVEPKTVSENSFIPPIIEDWNSDDESEIDYTVIPSIEKIKFVKPARETVEKRKLFLMHFAQEMEIHKIGLRFVTKILTYDINIHSEKMSDEASAFARRTVCCELLNGGLLNGGLLNGELLNGELLNGELLNGELLNGELLNGELLNGELLNGELLNGELLNGELLNGELIILLIQRVNKSRQRVTSKPRRFAYMQEDIQCAGSDTRPPMLDRTDFESWQQRIRLYCLGKDNGENIMKSINEGPFHMGTVSDVSAGGTEGAVQQGPVRARILNGILAEEKERFTKLINDMRNIKMTMPRMQLNSKFVNNMLPEWSRFITEVKLNRGLKESNFDQLYAYLKQHEVHANENRIMMERFIQPNNDPLALVSDASVQQYPTQSSKSPQPTKEPSPADHFQLDSGSSSTENLIESLSNTLALLTHLYKSHLPQTNNQLRDSSNARNKAMVQ
ncbi:hypothetical protein Tco_1410198, partial [Tanacetum coccineum]